MSDQVTMQLALKRAIETVHGAAALAARLGITTQAVWQWSICPPLRVLDVERETGVSRHDLRPDLFGPIVSAGHPHSVPHRHPVVLDCAGKLNDAR